MLRVRDASAEKGEPYIKKLGISAGDTWLRQGEHPTAEAGHKLLVEAFLNTTIAPRNVTPGF